MFISEGNRKSNKKKITFINAELLPLQNEYLKKVYKIKLHPWKKISEIKSFLSNKLKIKSSYIRLFLNNVEMINTLTTLDYQLFTGKNCEIFYRIKKNYKYNKGYVEVYGNFYCDEIQPIIEKINQGFNMGLNPIQIEHGTSGVYMLRDSNKEIISVFKPIDEEAFTPNNQKGYLGKFGQSSFRKGILSGEGNMREVIASLISNNKNNFFNVPNTTFVELEHISFYTKILKFSNNVDSKSYKKIRASIIHNFINESMELNTINNNSNNHQTKSKLFEEEYEISSQIIDLKDICENKNFKNSNYSKFSKFLIENSMIINDLLIKDTEEKNKLDDKSESSNSIVRSLPNLLSKKYGSLQVFIKDAPVAAEYGSNLFYNDCVHKIGLLDLRILNCDRNDENILVKNQGKYMKLIPIDHSLSFPDCIEINEYDMCWMSWNQSKLPFSNEIIDYIRELDIYSEINHVMKYIKIRSVRKHFINI